MEKKPRSNAHILHDAALRETRNIEKPRSNLKLENPALINKKTGKAMIEKLR